LLLFKFCWQPNKLPQNPQKLYPLKISTIQLFSLNNIKTQKALPPNLQQSLSHGYAPAEVITTNENLPSTSAFFVDSNDQTTTYLVQCKGKCCEDSLEVYQVTNAKVLKSTRKVRGHARQFNADWYKLPMAGSMRDKIACVLCILLLLSQSESFD